MTRWFDVRLHQPHGQACCRFRYAEAALHRGLGGLVWKDEGTDAYIRDTLELVRDLDSVLTTIKDNVSHIEELLKTFERNLMFDRKVIPGYCPLLGWFDISEGIPQGRRLYKAGLPALFQPVFQPTHGAALKVSKCAVAKLN
jgi:hypothetical protein